MDVLQPEDYDRLHLTPAEHAAETVELSSPVVHAGRAVHRLHFRALTAGDWLRVLDLPEGARGAQIELITHRATGLPNSQIERLAPADLVAVADACGQLALPFGGGSTIEQEISVDG